jgi:hypothetical protein
VAGLVEKFSAEAYFRALCKGESPSALASLLDSLESPLGRDIFKMAYAIDALEPLAFIRPGPNDLEEIYQKSVTAPPATLAPNSNGKEVVGTDVLLGRFCAPEGKILVLRECEVSPSDLTATQSGLVVYKRIAALTFSEGFCFSGEAADGDEAGTFQSIQNLILPANGGIDVYGRNLNLFSPATFTIRARYWATC